PSLRERPEDVAPLAQTFASAAGLGELPSAVIEQLEGREWPGNVRELQNAIHAYAALGVVPGEPRNKLDALRRNLVELIDTARPYVDQKDAIVDYLTELYLQRLMSRAAGNVSEAARLSGLSRGYLGRLLVKHGFQRAVLDETGELLAESLPARAKGTD